MNDKIIRHIDSSIQTKERLKRNLSSIEKTAEHITRCLRNNGKVILLGNGGSAADAQHIAAEFVGKFAVKRRGLPALALTTNTSTLTAIGNDFGFKRVFARQIEAHGRGGDVVIAISTSGNSSNVLEAVKTAKRNNIVTVGMTGQNGGKLAALTDITIKVPSKNTQHIQESHIMIGHILTGLAESSL